jgi:hypothetical protein
VWLPEPLDPKTAKVVRPSHFAEVIGGGTRLVSMTVEITNDKPDRSIYERLPWLAQIEREQRANGMLKISPQHFKLSIDHLLGDE